MSRELTEVERIQEAAFLRAREEGKWELADKNR